MADEGAVGAGGKATEEEESNGKPEEAGGVTLSKTAQKKLLKRQWREAKKAEKKAQMKEHKKKEKERKRKEWQEKLSMASEEEKAQLMESKLSQRKERKEKWTEEREMKIRKLTDAKLHGQNIVVDLQFSDLMSPSEIHSLSKQIMYCHAANSRCKSPCHLWLTGCTGAIGDRLNQLPGFDKWMIEKQTVCYIEALRDRKDNLVYLTADAETVLEDLDPNDFYIIGGLVDRNRYKGVTLKKAQEQGIRAAKLPIGDYLKLSSSQVLTVNQVMEILLKYLETRDWKASFFHVIPQRKICEAKIEENGGEATDGESEEDEDDSSEGRKKLKISSEANDEESEPKLRNDDVTEAKADESEKVNMKT